MDWFDFLAVQGPLKSLLQHHNAFTSILRHSAFFTVQLSYLYMTPGKADSLEKTLMLGKIERQKEKGVAEDEIVR